MRFHAGYWATFEFDCAAIRREPADEEVEEGAFSGAVRSDETMNAALPELDRRFLYSPYAAKALLESDSGQCGTSRMTPERQFF
jgi:hypothetical protein